MAPSKHVGFRYSKRSPTSLAPFRGDLNLVALPYDLTIPAEPPIPIYARDPGRCSPTLTATSSSSSCVSLQLQQQQRQEQTTQQITLLAKTPNSPPPLRSDRHLPAASKQTTTIVVAPPLLPFAHAAIAPPREQHPALRDSSVRAGFLEQSWKRDSGVARTSSSATTIVEEDEDDDDDECSSFFKGDKDTADRGDWRRRRKLPWRDTGSSGSTRPSYDQGSIAEVPETLDVVVRGPGAADAPPQEGQGDDSVSVVKQTDSGLVRTVSVTAPKEEDGSNHDQKSDQESDQQQKQQHQHPHQQQQRHPPNASLIDGTPLADPQPAPCTPPETLARRLAPTPPNLPEGGIPFGNTTEATKMTAMREMTEFGGSDPSGPLAGATAGSLVDATTGLSGGLTGGITGGITGGMVVTGGAGVPVEPGPSRPPGTPEPSGQIPPEPSDWIPPETPEMPSAAGGTGLTVATTTTATATDDTHYQHNHHDHHHHNHHHNSHHNPGPASPTLSARTSRTWRTATTTFSSFSAKLPRQPRAQSPSQFFLSRTRPSSSTTAPTVAPRSPPSPRSPARFFSRPRSSQSPPRTAPAPVHQFSPIAIAIPHDNFVDDFVNGLTFSKRGSLLLSGKRASRAAAVMEYAARAPSASQQSHSSPSPAGFRSESPPEQPHSESRPQALQPAAQLAEAATPHHGTSGTGKADAPSTTSGSGSGPQPIPHLLLMPADAEKESQKVRSLYEFGDVATPESCRALSFAERLETTPEDPREDSDNGPYGSASAAHSPTSPTRHHRRSRRSADASGSARSRSGRDGSAPPPAWGTPRSSSILSYESPSRREHELAGGMEDWEDVNCGDVDRYGFISQPRRNESRCASPTDAKSAPNTPRRRNVLLKRDFSGRAPSRKLSARSLNTQHSEMSTTSRRSARSAFRQAGNLLPHNRDRRWMDEAGDMLTMNPMADVARDDAEDSKASDTLKRKEWERAEKWRRMAKVIRHGQEGHGMEFEFDTKSPKLIERTWKGIPDRWRASAWFSFLRASARERPGSATEAQIIDDFHRLQQQSSPDDVQIDLDVPRTISRHIMFRRRYRGGQRLLFRVLHAVSIYFPQTGYVQGMASLAATLLCYFDEEQCFVMMVRMWQFRGLELIYQPGFEQLILVLKEFETKWMGDKDVAKKLTELNIDATAYGARWYLTLFNLSIPFAAQLRVWDVFLLLGGTAAPGSPSPSPSPSPTTKTINGLDVLHATGAALMHALRDVLMDSDFENTMKALTSWIPIKDEDLLMKVVRAEWKLHQGKRKA